MFEAPALPCPRGPVSDAVMTSLRRAPGASVRWVPPAGDPLGDDDLHLALYVCYELHYRGWAGVHHDWEWDPALLGVRARLERSFVRALEDEITPIGPMSAAATATALRALVDGADGPSLSRFVEEHATLEQLRELAIHRSPYQLKEADPHTWAIPRLPSGVAKSALVGLQLDEYGNGVPGRSHAELFARTMEALGLDPTYGRHLDHVPGVVLATVNLLSMFGLHRRWAAACVGHLAVFEMTSVAPMARYARAMRRLTGRDAGAEFYDVHVVADAEHEVIAIDQLVPGLLEADPGVGADVLFGASTLMALEERVARHVLGCWREGRSSLYHADESLVLAS